MKNSLETLEEALRQLDPGPPPADLAARCIAALPDPPVRSIGFTTRLVRFSRRPLTLAVATLATLVLIAVWTTYPVAHRDRVAHAPVSAFADTVKAMGKVTAWHSTSRQICFDPGEGKTKFRYHFEYGWVTMNDWFDADHGLYCDQPMRDGVTVQRSLLLPNGDWYFRRADHSLGRDKVRINQMGKPYWEKTRDEQLKNLRNPAYWASSFDQTPTAAPTSRLGNWKGQSALVFLFETAPSAAYKDSDPPTQRTEIYVDPATQLIRARQQFSRWPQHPERGERITWIQEFEYTPLDTASLFDPQAFCEGTKEIQKQVGGPGITLDPE